jgi:hypothetical protein
MKHTMITAQPQPEQLPDGELRQEFHRQLAELQDNVLEMTSMVDRSIERSPATSVSSSPFPPSPPNSSAWPITPRATPRSS